MESRAIQRQRHVVFIACALLLLTGCSRAEEAHKQIVCNAFELAVKITGARLDLSVDTDLPDSTVVMVNVSRSYVEEGNPTTYSEHYFSERSTVGKWKTVHGISIAGEVWKSALRSRQEEMARMGLGFNVAAVSEKIAVSMTVPINQPDRRFGDQNRNLTGKAVRTSGLRVVADEVEIVYPLSAPPVGKSPYPNLSPWELAVGQSYIVAKDTPLMPSHSPADPLAELQKMKKIPQGGGFRVLEVYKGEVHPWYKVKAFDSRRAEIGTGWINSIALVGQQLKADI